MRALLGILSEDDLGIHVAQDFNFFQMPKYKDIYKSANLSQSSLI